VSDSRLAIDISISLTKMNLVKLFKKSPLVYLALAFITGLILGTIVDSKLFSIILLVIGFSLLFFKNNSSFTIGIWVCVASFGMFNMQSAMAEQQLRGEIASKFHEETIDFEGIVVDIKSTEKGFKYRLQLTEIDEFETWVFQKTKMECKLGDTLEGNGEFQHIAHVRNPGEFDFKSFYSRQNLYGWIFPDKYEQISVSKNANWHFGRFIHELQQTIRQLFNTNAEGDAGGLLSALILGDKSDVTPDIKESFAKTGVIHVLAVSGLHVGYVLIILLLIKNVFSLPWGYDRIVVILGLVLFVILTGGKASVIRASIMAGLYVLSPVFNRTANIWNIIGGAAFAILCFRPMDLYDLGFQLSFLSVASIIYFYEWFENVLPENIKVSKINNKVVQFFWGLFLVSFAAQIGTLPMTSHIFGKVPLVALIANILIVPLIGVLVGIGFFLLFLSWIPGMGFALGNAAWLVSKIITFLTQTFSNFTFSTINMSFSLFNVAQYFMILFAIVLLFDVVRRKYGIFILLIVSNIIIWNGAFEEDDLDVIFLDVGQGDATLIMLPNEKVMLIDAGQRNRHEDYGEEVVLPVLKHFSINKLDWVVMSHPHSDHIGGIISILKEVKIDTMWDSFISYSSWTYKNIIETAVKKEIEIIRPHQGQILKLSENVLVEFFAPDSAFAVSEHNVNNASIVFKLSYGKTSILFTGDLEHEGDQFLLPYEHMLKTDVLKVAHHGSITSTTKALLDYIQPYLAVVSVGWKNKFKHPSAIVMDRLKERHIQIHRTDYEGALWLKSDGENFREEKWK